MGQAWADPRGGGPQGQAGLAVHKTSGSIKTRSAHVRGSRNSVAVPRVPNISSAAAAPAANRAQESGSFVLAGRAAKSACRARCSLAVTEISSSGAASAEAVNHFPRLLFVRMKPRENFKLLRGWQFPAKMSYSTVKRAKELVYAPFWTVMDILH